MKKFIGMALVVMAGVFFCGISAADEMPKAEANCYCTTTCIGNTCYTHCYGCTR